MKPLRSYAKRPWHETSLSHSRVHSVKECTPLIRVMECFFRNAVGNLPTAALSMPFLWPAANSLYPGMLGAVNQSIGARVVVVVVVVVAVVVVVVVFVFVVVVVVAAAAAVVVVVSIWHAPATHVPAPRRQGVPSAARMLPVPRTHTEKKQLPTTHSFKHLS